MKSFVPVILLSLVIVSAQPVEDASAIAEDVAGMEKSVQPEDSSAFDLEPSASGLKVIEHKLEHWLKKYYKHQDKNSNHGFNGYPVAGYPIVGLPLLGYPFGYGYGLGGLSGYNLAGLGGYGSALGGYGSGLGGYGTGLAGYGTGVGGYGSLAGYGLGGGYGLGNGYGLGGGYGLGNGYGLGGGGGYSGYGFRR